MSKTTEVLRQLRSYESRNITLLEADGSWPIVWKRAKGVHVSDASGKRVLDREDTVRTNFYSQAAGSTGTLTHPIAQKIADRIKDARLK